VVSREEGIKGRVSGFEFHLREIEVAHHHEVPPAMSHPFLDLLCEDGDCCLVEGDVDWVEVEAAEESWLKEGLPLDHAAHKVDFPSAQGEGAYVHDAKGGVDLGLLADMGAGVKSGVAFQAELFLWLTDTNCQASEAT
jgi:hypothetical protein